MESICIDTVGLGQDGINAFFIFFFIIYKDSAILMWCFTGIWLMLKVNDTLHGIEDRASENRIDKKGGGKR